MRLLLAAVGTRMPRWAEMACAEYANRLPAEWRFELREIRAEPRTGGRRASQAMAAEAERLSAALPEGAHLVALDEHGERLDTRALAARLQRWQQEGCSAALLIGGPDGLDPGMLQRAAERWRLSDFTLPHALARVLLVEQLYRAWSINAGHPYHRA